MALPGKPLVWSPKGAADTLDSSTAQPGSMAALTNLIPDPSTRDLWQCRPAAISIADFVAAGFNTPTFISCYKVIGSLIYGMVSTAATPGYDEPFCYNITTGLFVAITGVTSGNVPLSPAASGPWTPPNLDLIGSDVIIAHPGYTGAGGAYFGVIDVSNPAAPTYTGTNTATNALIAPPQWVQNFNGRCYFLVNPPNGQPAAYFSDSLAPTTITNANQILTFGDNVPLTCAMGLGLYNQLGGIVQSLMVFKSVNNIYQVTGDYAISGSLTVNTLNVATGTFAPNTVCETSKGLAFIAPDGLRVIDFRANVSDPIGNAGDGITVPFIYSVVPSRMCAAYNNGIYRVQVQNGNSTGSPQQQWWYDFVRSIWSGPHMINASFMAPYSNTFIVVLAGTTKLWQSDPVQNATSTYVENGTNLQYSYNSPLFPDTDQMAEVEIVQSTIHMALVAGSNVLVQALDQNQAVLSTVTLTPAGATTIWGTFTWGNALWQGGQNALFPRPLNWPVPIVFRRMQYVVQGACAQGFKIGRTHMRYNVLGYLQQGS